MWVSTTVWWVLTDHRRKCLMSSCFEKCWRWSYSPIYVYIVRKLKIMNSCAGYKSRIVWTDWCLPMVSIISVTWLLYQKFDHYDDVFCLFSKFFFYLTCGDVEWLYPGSRRQVAILDSFRNKEFLSLIQKDIFLTELYVQTQVSSVHQDLAFISWSILSILLKLRRSNFL